MAILSFEALGVRFELLSEEVIANNSSSGPKIKKIRELYFLKL